MSAYLLCIWGSAIAARGPAAAAAERGRALLGALDRHGVLARKLAEGISDELEVFRPEQRQQVIGRVRLQILRLLQHGQKAHDLRVLDAGLERERAHAVLVQRPRDALVALIL